MSGKAIIWGFDGTLILHKGLWSGTMMAALDTLIRDHNISIECLKPYLNTGFPWHEAEKAHLTRNCRTQVPGGIGWKDILKRFLKRSDLSEDGIKQINIVDFLLEKTLGI